MDPACASTMWYCHLTSAGEIFYSSGMKKSLLYRGFRYPAEIISHNVWFYFRFSLSFRDIEELMASRGIIVTYETIRANNQGQAPLPLACSRSEWSCARYLNAESAQPAGSKTLSPQAPQGLGLCTTGADHRQAEELCRGEVCSSRSNGLTNLFS